MNERIFRRVPRDSYILPAGSAAVVQSRVEDPRIRPLGDLSPVFRDIAPGDCTRLGAAAHFKRFKRGEMLQVEGGAIQQIFLLIRGIAKITQLGLRGSEVIVKLAVPGDIVGAVSLFCRVRRCTTAQAFRPCETLVWEAPAFKTFVGALPTLKQNFLRALVKDLKELEERFREVSTERVAPRVARQIIRLAEQIGQPANDGIEIALSREELAQMTGSTSFTVSRLLSLWQTRGIVKPRREAVTICDLGSLRAIADE